MSFDAETPATGFHPLWLALVTPLFAGSEFGARGPIIAVLVLAAILTAISANNLFRFARRLELSSGASFAIALGFSANFYLIRESLNGLETSLGICLLTFAWIRLNRVLDQPLPRDCWWLGVVSGLAILARSDLAVVLVTLYAAMLIVRVPLRGILRASVGPVIAVGSISVTSYLLTGSPLQSSASAAPWLSRANWVRAFGEESNPGMMFVRSGLVDTWGAMGIVSVVALGLAIAVILVIGALFRANLQRRDGMALLTLALLGAGMLQLHFIHGYFRWMPRAWYFPAWAVVVWGAVAVAAAVSSRGMERQGSPAQAANFRATVMGILALLVVAEFVQTGSRLDFVRFEQQLELAQAGRELGRHVATEERIGSFNSGVIAYLSGARVVNLDGVVNQDAAQRIRDQSLQAYLEELEIDLLVDSPVMWSFIPHEHSTGPYFGEDFRYVRRSEVARFDRPGVGFGGLDESVALMRFDWAGSRPWDGEVIIDLATIESSRFLDEGWSPRIRDASAVHRRLVGDSASLLVALEGFTDYELGLRANRGGGVGAPIVEVSLNEKAVGSLRLDRAGLHDYHIALPSFLVAERNRLSLRVADDARATLRLYVISLSPLRDRK